MNISDALIEKYHQGLCNPEETEAIEKWLQNGEEDEFEFPAEVSVKEIKMEVWKDLQPHLITRNRSLRPAFRKYAGMAAAAMVIVVFGVRYLKDISTDTGTNGLLAHEISSPQQTEALKIEFGSESGAVYSKENKMLDFCGVVKITPKENMKLSFTSLCDGNRETIKEIDVKGGTTYFAMDLKHQDSSELVVMDTNLVGELPPIVQNSLIAQFGI